MLDTEYAADEYAFVSDWNPDEVGSRIPARHIAAGPPRTFFFTLGFQL